MTRNEFVLQRLDVAFRELQIIGIEVQFSPAILSVVLDAARSVQKAMKMMAVGQKQGGE